MPAPDQNFRIKRFADLELDTSSTGVFWTETVPSGRSWEILQWIADESAVAAGTIEMQIAPAGSDTFQAIDAAGADYDKAVTVHLREGDRLRLEATASGNADETISIWLSYIEYRPVAAAP